MPERLKRPRENEFVISIKRSRNDWEQVLSLIQGYAPEEKVVELRRIWLACISNYDERINDKETDINNLQENVHKLNSVVITLFHLLSNSATDNCWLNAIKSLKSSFLWREGHLVNAVCSIDRRRKSTSILLSMCVQSEPLNPDVVRKCVRNGGDVERISPEMHLPILYCFVVSGATDAVRACLETQYSIDFSAAYSHGWTLLHYLCGIQNSNTAIDILRLVSERLQRSPNDKVDFFQPDVNGLDFLSHAALQRRLSLFWPIISRHGQIEDCEKIKVSFPIDPEDWSNVDPNEHQYFDAVISPYNGIAVKV